MTILLLKGYNNYFNRIVKQENSIPDYKSLSDSFLEYTDVNFDPNDGIATSIVVGGPNQKISETLNGVTSTRILDFEDSGSPDYFIAYENLPLAQGGPKIHSRWFIIECVRTRAGQYKLALKRDVLVDFYNEVMNSPCFVEKGNIQDIDNPLLLNSEGMTFNQQKQKEYLLRDDTYSAWIVGYLKKNMASQTITYTWPGSVPQAVPYNSLPFADCITYYNQSSTVTSASKKAVNIVEGRSTVKFRVQWKSNNNLNYDIREVIGLDNKLVSCYQNGISSDWEGLTTFACYLDHHGTGADHINYVSAEKVGRELFDHTINWGYVNDAYKTMLANAKTSVITNAGMTEVDENFATTYNGQFITKDGKVYRLNIKVTNEKTVEKYYNGNDGVSNNYLSMLYYSPDFGQYVSPGWTVQRNQADPDKTRVKVSYIVQEYEVNAIEEPIGETISLTLPAGGSRNECSDSTYDMFCMPVDPSALGLNFEQSDVYIGSPTQARVLNITKNNLALAMQMATSAGAGTDQGWIYDLQLLPFCPMGKDFVNKCRVTKSDYQENPSDVRIMLTDLTEGKDYNWIYNSEATPKKRGIIFYPKAANFDASIKFSVDSTHIEEEEKKIEYPELKYMSHSDDTGYEGDWPLYYIDFPYSSVSYPTIDDISWSSGIQDWIDANKAALLGWYGGSGNTVGLYFVVFEKGEYDPLATYDPITFDGNQWFSVYSDWIVEDTTIDKKIANECDFYRITSPNYNSFYEFKKSKLSNNSIKELRAICTYKPHTPYIKVNPNLDGSLYSVKDYNDNIGLMLGGDYSIPMISDAMINYELQNRNYQAIFNRQIQNLDVNQRIAKEQQQFTGIVGAITGGVGGVAGGALAGSKAGPYGAIAGAVIGGVGGTAAGLVGYEKDKQWLLEQQVEARDFAVDQFQYQLGNIQALPQSMTKSTPLSYNNKIWPILELFSCTKEEKDVLRKKLRFNGMTIMVVDNLIKYRTASGFLKGKMIRIEGLKDDSHIAQAIYEEVDKGFYEGE